jgi:hypothetical protein
VIRKEELYPGQWKRYSNILKQVPLKTLPSW